MTGFRFQDLIPLMAAEGRISLLPLKYSYSFNSRADTEHTHTHTRHRREVTRNVHQQQDGATHRCQHKMALVALLMTTEGKKKKKRSSLLTVSPRFSLAERRPASLGQEIKMWAACGGVWEVAEFISRIFFGLQKEAGESRRRETVSTERPQPEPGASNLRPSCCEATVLTSLHHRVALSSEKYFYVYMMRRQSTIEGQHFSFFDRNQCYSVLVRNYAH